MDEPFRFRGGSAEMQPWQLWTPINSLTLTTKRRGGLSISTMHTGPGLAGSSLASSGSDLKAGDNGDVHRLADASSTSIA
jgi:hypothetical protein